MRNSVLQSKVPCPIPAKSDEPLLPQRPYLKKMEIGRARSFSRRWFVTRLRRTRMLQELWCTSVEGASVYENLAAYPDVTNFGEQLTEFDLINPADRNAYTTTEANFRLWNHKEPFTSVKYDETSTPTVAEQESRSIVDRLIVFLLVLLAPIRSSMRTRCPSFESRLGFEAGQYCCEDCCSFDSGVQVRAAILDCAGQIGLRWTIQS